MARRQTAAIPVVPQSRPVINLEEWETRAPLGDIETRSVNLVKATSEHFALPLKVRPTLITQSGVAIGIGTVWHHPMRQELLLVYTTMMTDGF